MLSLTQSYGNARGRNTGVAVEEADELDASSARSQEQLLQALVPYRPLAEVLNGEFKQEWYLQRTFSSTNDADLRNPHRSYAGGPSPWKGRPAAASATHWHVSAAAPKNIITSNKTYACGNCKLDASLCVKRAGRGSRRLDPPRARPRRNS